MSTGTKSIGQKPWHYDDSAFQSTPTLAQASSQKGYQILVASGQEITRVANWYQRHPVKGLVIKSVQIIHNPQMVQGFESRIALLEQRHGNPAFAPKWEQESINETEKKQRQYTILLLKDLAKPYQDPENPHVSLIPLWHGTSPTFLESLLATGYENLATTDSGFFGKGIYSTENAEYAHRVYSKGVLLVNWVAFYSAFPVIHKDMKELESKGNYQNYDAHFIPVVPRDPTTPHEVIYYPCAPGQTHTYTEMVVFNPFQSLPRYLVELQPEMPFSPFSSNSNAPNLTVNDLLEALLNYQDTLDSNSPKYTSIEAKINLYGTQNRSLNEKEIAVYNLVQRIQGAQSNQKQLFSKKMLSLLQQMNQPGETDMNLPPIGAVSKSSPPPTWSLAPSFYFQPLQVQFSPPPMIIISINKPNASTPPIPTAAFGKEKWAAYFGDIGVEPPLPPDISTILANPCPIWKGEKIEDTHMLVLIPKTVNGRPLTLRNLEELVKAPLKGNAIDYRYFGEKTSEEHGDTPMGQSHWVLMTKDVIPESIDKSYKDQQALVASLAKKAQDDYQIPKALEAAVCIFMAYVSTGKRLFSDSPWTYTYCQEKNSGYQLIVGGFTPDGLCVFNYADCDNFGGDGVAALRKW